jgi:NAD(P)-dependent dehydrogenase (short-subunit alcohol dehydrogenase family)
VILEGKTVVITGVGPGLGAETARLALRDGANIVMAARKQERLAAFAAELGEPDRVLAVPTDITDADACVALVEAGVERFGGIDALAQVAARDAVMGTLADSHADDFRTCFDTNVIGSLNAVEAARPALDERGGGAVVLTGSQSSALPVGSMPQIAYATSKGALQTAMFHLAHELGAERIRVNLVVPTWMWGPPVEMFVDWQSGERDVPREEIISEITAGMSLDEIPADEDVAEAIVWLCSDRARMITGQTLMVNAGELKR